MPLQSLSSPSHVSAEGLTVWLQARAPATHDVIPVAQTPGWPVSHDAPPPGSLSSTMPSQSLSSPSQISLDGWTFCTQTTAPFVHVVVPGAQGPIWPVSHAAPPSG